MLKGKRLSEGIVGRKRLFGHPTPEEVVGAVSKAFGVNEEEIWERGGRASTARRVAIYFCHRYTGLSNRVIGELFGGIHDSTVSKVTARLRAEMVKDKELSKLTNRLYSHFKA